ncbi:hypothetical protein [Marinactinospora rubrisoli]|uniref:HNH endonuclease n=1 Tax=Marinactinospora rubrisoli TaxID=2715399 RepID=A0ABW2KGS6_9ACTN
MSVPDPAPASRGPAARPWWVLLSRWMNGVRVCAVPDCIELTDPDLSHCHTHVRELRAALGERRCADPGCVLPRDGDDPLCHDHRDAELISGYRPETPAGRWNV